MEQRNKRRKMHNIEQFNQPEQFERKKRSQGRADMRFSGTHGNASNNSNYSTRRPGTRYNNRMSGNAYSRNVSFGGNNSRNFNTSNERFQRRNNVNDTPRQMPRIMSDQTFSPSIQVKPRISEYNPMEEVRSVMSGQRSIPVKPRQSRYDPKEEARLTKIIFGDASDIIDKLPDEPVPEYLGQDTSDTVDQNNTKETVETEATSDADESDTDCNSEADQSRHVAWVDEDDTKFTVTDAIKRNRIKVADGWTETYYKEMLENKYKKLVGTPKWAELDKEEEGDSDELENEILKHCSHLGKAKGKSLPKGIIELKAMSLLNKQTHNEGPIISSMEFHPTSTVGFVAGSSGNVSIFQVDGIENNKLHTMQYKKFPISRAKFLREGTEILAGSQFFSHCHCYNLISGKNNRIPLPHGITSMKRFEVSPDGKLIALCGRSGEVYLLTSSSKELIGQLKMNARCRALAFSPNSKTLITHGDSNEMYIWDLNSRMCIHRAVDDGCITCESIAVSPNGQFVATGSKQGVVNVYEMDTVLKQDVPTPLKIVLNLVTSITSLKFNPTSEILAMASNKKHNAFKMMHIPSFTIFPNFPTFQTTLSMPELIDFSPGSGYLGISNRSHSAFLFRLKHFQNY